MRTEEIREICGMYGGMVVIGDKSCGVLTDVPLEALRGTRRVSTRYGLS